MGLLNVDGVDSLTILPEDRTAVSGVVVSKIDANTKSKGRRRCSEGQRVEKLAPKQILDRNAFPASEIRGLGYLRAFSSIPVLRTADALYCQTADDPAVRLRRNGRNIRRPHDMFSESVPEFPSLM